jgi:hypothetical protein
MPVQYELKFLQPYPGSKQSAYFMQLPQYLFHSCSTQFYDSIHTKSEVQNHVLHNNASLIVRTTPHAKSSMLTLTP